VNVAIRCKIGTPSIVISQNWHVAEQELFSEVCRQHHLTNVIETVREIPGVAFLVVVSPHQNLAPESLSGLHEGRDVFLVPSDAEVPTMDQEIARALRNRL